jgi:V/A-type H+/Na+-transporting ATPase subunit I
MSLRPIAARWFELVTVHKELARVMECLSRTGAVELEARSRVTDRLLFPGLDEALKTHRDLTRRYQHYWPAPAATAERRSELLSETLKAASTRLSAWTVAADPIITAIEKLSQEAVDLEQLRTALQCAGADFPDLHRLSLAGPKLQVRLLLLPAGVLPRELPALVLFKPWQAPDVNYALVVGRPSDIVDIETQLQGLKGHVLRLPSWLPPSPDAAVTVIAQRLVALAQQRSALTARLAELSERRHLASALGDIALIEWLNEHAKELHGSERLAWVTGWTSDVGGAGLLHALDACDVRYILRLSDAPAGMNAPLVLRNPGWASTFEVFARMLGTPGQYESDPSQLLAVIASSIFGFMFGDVGQGAVVCLTGLVFGRRIPLIRMLVPGGIMAMVFGVLFGSVFCREDIIPALWLRPMAEPVTVLIVAVVAGVAIMTLGLLLDAIQMHWRGAARAWWAQRAGLLTAYAGLLIAPLRMDGLLLAAFGAAWFIVGAVALAQERQLSVFAAAAAEFVEQTLRLLVNTVSFARIGAFALAHAGLSVAILEMANASGRIGFWIVLAIGNVLVIVLEGVVVSIQTTRLLLFEFFIRFLTGMGREFKPLPPPIIATMQEPNLRGTS